MKASIAALHFIIASAAKYSVDGDSLSNELQQLGLPKGMFNMHKLCMKQLSQTCFKQPYDRVHSGRCRLMVA